MADLFYLKCPYCKEAVHVSADGPGTPANCPACRKGFRVPSAARASGPTRSAVPAAVPAGPPAIAAADTAAPAPTTPPQTWNPALDELHAAQAELAPDFERMTHLMAESLRGTRPWTLFMAVTGFVVTGLFALLAIVTLSDGQLWATLSNLVTAALVLAPSLHLLNYSNSIANFLADRSARSMELALTAQRSYWMFVGIVTIIYICMVLLMLWLAMLMGIDTPTVL